MGWIPDWPDPRDYTYRHHSVLTILQRLELLASTRVDEEVDLRRGDDGEDFFTDVEDQGHANSSSAFAVIALAEYFERRTHGRTFDGSKRFLYKVSRSLRNRTNRIAPDIGVDLRTTLKALQKVGVPDEEYWPYDTVHINDEPDAFVYSVARPMSCLRYFRFPNPLEAEDDGSQLTLWRTLTSFLSAGFPIAFGFSVPSSLASAPDIPYRPDLDHILGGQSVLAIGYRLNHYGRNQHALLIRSSWGKQWGDNGNGWLPYQTIRRTIARDFWTLADETWTESTDLSLPLCLRQ